MNLMIVIYIFFTTLGLTFMKLGGNTFSLGFKGGINFEMQYLTLLGFAFYAISFLIWQKIVVMHNISTIFAVTTAFIQIIVLLIGIFIFKENVKFINIVGMVCILIGVLLITTK